MQVTVENSGGLQRRLTVQVPNGEVQEKVDARLREIGKTAKLKGFRPGRIPMKVLSQRYGPTVRREIVFETMQSSLNQAIQQEALRPASRPVIENITEAKGEANLEFSATIEVYPEFDRIDATALTLKRPEVEVTESDVDDMLHTLREQRQELIDVERPPQAGDHALFDYVQNGEEAGERKHLTVIMGASGLDKLEKKLASMSVGEEATVKQKFPEDFPEPSLAGQNARINVRLAAVKKPKLPEVDEEFIKSFGIESGDVGELRAEIRNNLEREMATARSTFVKTQVIEGLMSAHQKTEVPEGLVRDEATRLATREARMAGREEPDPERVQVFMEMARRRVKSGLLLNEVARQNDILVDGARVRQAVETLAGTYEQSREVVQMYYQNPELLRSVEVSVLEDQVVDWMLDHAKVDSTAMAFKDLINAATISRQGL